MYFCMLKGYLIWPCFATILLHSNSCFSASCNNCGENESPSGELSCKRFAVSFKRSLNCPSKQHKLFGRKLRPFVFITGNVLSMTAVGTLVEISQEAQLSPSDRTMHLVSSNLLANYRATMQKLLIWQVLTKPMVWSWRFSWRQCVINVCTQLRRDRVALIVSPGVINKPTTDELCISPVYRRLAVVKFSKFTL